MIARGGSELVGYQTEEPALELDEIVFRVHRLAVSGRGRRAIGGKPELGGEKRCRILGLKPGKHHFQIKATAGRSLRGDPGDATRGCRGHAIQRFPENRCESGSIVFRNQQFGDGFAQCRWSRVPEQSGRGRIPSQDDAVRIQCQDRLGGGAGDSVQPGGQGLAR